MFWICFFSHFFPFIQPFFFSLFPISFFLFSFLKTFFFQSMCWKSVEFNVLKNIVKTIEICFQYQFLKRWYVYRLFCLYTFDDKWNLLMIEFNWKWKMIRVEQLRSLEGNQFTFFQKLDKEEQRFQKKKYTLFCKIDRFKKVVFYQNLNIFFNSFFCDLYFI